ncbi:MAG: TIGR04141 family sporadically distributed protein [Lentilitoribacter sp.]
MSKTKTYSLYLVKEELEDSSGVLTDRAKDRIVSKSVHELNAENRLGEKAVCFVFQNPLNEPSWIQDLKEVFDDVQLIRNRSSSALVIFKASGRIFVSTFGSAWQYINDRAIESDFGLKVTINSLEDGRVKRIDSSHLGEAMKGVSQSAFQRDIQSFGIDEALDQVRRITGRLQKSEFAKNLSGATSLKISREMSFDELGEIAIESLNRYYSDFYKSTSFHIIDKIRPITDRSLIDELDNSAADQIRSGTDSFELSMPGWSEDDVVYFGINGSGLQERFPDLLLSHYREAMQKKLADLDSDTILNKHGIVAEFNNDIAAKKRWSIKKALIGSINYQGGMYAISEGEWYRLDHQFKDDIDSAMPTIVESWPSEPLIIVKKISDDGKKNGF